MKSRWVIYFLFHLLPGAAVCKDAIASEKEVIRSGNECPARTNVRVAADCIELEVYLPCELSSRVGTFDCAWAYAEVAERKLKRTEQEILDAFKGRRAEKQERDAFIRWQRNWAKFRVNHCELSERLAELVVQGKDGIVENGTDFHRGFCMRRLNENRLVELNRFLEITVSSSD
jgi:uncharacterized protein YecT (DUF1311 family)